MSLNEIMNLSSKKYAHFLSILSYHKALETLMLQFVCCLSFFLPVCVHNKALKPLNAVLLWDILNITYENHSALENNLACDEHVLFYLISFCLYVWFFRSSTSATEKLGAPECHSDCLCVIYGATWAWNDNRWLKIWNQQPLIPMLNFN